MKLMKSLLCLTLASAHLLMVALAVTSPCVYVTNDIERNVCYLNQMIKGMYDSYSRSMASRPPRLTEPTFQTQQSSTAGDFTSDLAHDGSLQADARLGSCSFTQSQTQPWWRILYSSQITIEGVTVMGRSDCCEDQFTRLIIYVGSQVCNTFTGPGEPGIMYSLPCTEPILANDVTIMRHISSRPLQLCEVKVIQDWSKVEQGPIFSNKTSMSSVEEGSSSDKAYDGSMAAKKNNGDCSVSTISENPFWSVVFDSPTVVSAVTMTPPDDCCGSDFKNIVVYVDGVVCGRFKGPAIAGMKYTVTCSDFLTGEEVKIQQIGIDQQLNLCEVEIL